LVVRPDVWELTSGAPALYRPRAVGSLRRTLIRNPKWWPAAALVALLAAALAPAAHASRGWVGRDYYGINFQQLREQSPAESSKHLTKIAKLGIHEMRVGFAWPRIEPLPPVNGKHTYRWDAMDSEIRALAHHGIQAQANITQTPRWNADTSIVGAINCNRSSSWTPLDIGPYGPLVKAIAARFGRGGTFWKAHPGLPAKPITRYEIWNEPNLRGGWCPNPQPERYADMFMIAASAIHSVDPHAQVLTGGVAPPAKTNRHYLGISEFLGRVTTRQPGLVRKASGAAVHIYPPTGASKQLDRVALFRDELRQGGIPNRIPMLINEIGWPTQGGGETISEDERSRAYRDATVNIPRTNCNVMGIVPQAWTSKQQDPKKPEDWYGIAGPVTARPYPSAHAYSRALRLMTGQRAKPPPNRPLMVCPGMPAPKPPDGAQTVTPHIRKLEAKRREARFKVRVHGYITDSSTGKHARGRVRVIGIHHGHRRHLRVRNHDRRGNRMFVRQRFDTGRWKLVARFRSNNKQKWIGRKTCRTFEMPHHVRRHHWVKLRSGRC
jgi:hypothetical protein